MIALAKYIGFRLSALGRDSVLQFASSLVEDEALRRRLYVKVRRVCRGKDDAARCEMFIINWARQRLKFENKVCVLFTCFRKVKIIFNFFQYQKSFPKAVNCTLFQLYKSHYFSVRLMYSFNLTAFQKFFKIIVLDLSCIFDNRLYC